ncbi:hypothetical protein BU14_0424s0019 [Porphyra umbilicalis]|uniref:Uncharacterized protein n=1 Tax=Porphyra umbilicalis TaxID=2786 RepID=A0A1X6NW13_PORUM|nr:hypothetical protein BU14_0424s0019 [Porphyra umbilicalis]|eukprot:OSX72563.1 hypothetical protein BU14_0424s0019 [Porphyra umbilicalis]
MASAPPPHISSVPVPPLLDGLRTAPTHLISPRAPAPAAVCLFDDPPLLPPQTSLAGCINLVFGGPLPAADHPPPRRISTARRSPRRRRRQAAGPPPPLRRRSSPPSPPLHRSTVTASPSPPSRLLFSPTDAHMILPPTPTAAASPPPPRHRLAASFSPSPPTPTATRCA